MRLLTIRVKATDIIEYFQNATPINKGIVKWSMACYVVNMRVLILLLIFCIGFSGFSTAAHAIEPSHCGSSSLVEVDDSTSAAVDDCTEMSQKSKSGESKEQGHVCLNCGHCCVSHLALADLDITVDVPVIKSTFTIVDSDVDNDFISTLKRPPKSLV